MGTSYGGTVRPFGIPEVESTCNSHCIGLVKLMGALVMVAAGLPWFTMVHDCENCLAMVSLW